LLHVQYNVLLVYILTNGISLTTAPTEDLSVNMGLFFALLSSVCYGAADFLGGHAARRVSIGYVLLWNQIPGLLITCLFTFATSGAMTSASDWLWSIAAGLSISIQLPALYLALGAGPMAVVAPVTALIGIVVPVIFGVVVGHESPSAQAYVGLLIGALAIAIVSGAEPASAGKGEKSRSGQGLLLAAVAGSCIAVTYICLKQVSGPAGLAPLAAARAVALLLVLIALLPRRRVTLTMRPDRWASALIALSGCLDASGTVLFRSALIHGGPLSIVATLVSLYPLTTVLLATTLLRERLSWQRVLGVLLALSGIGLMVRG
jgi:drug/metabolite transporter (DMT)-like permease